MRITSGLDQDDVLTTREVQRLLRGSKPTLYDLMRRGKLPGRKVGRAYRFSRIALLGWLEGKGAFRTHGD